MRGMATFIKTTVLLQFLNALFPPPSFIHQLRVSLKIIINFLQKMTVLLSVGGCVTPMALSYGVMFVYNT